MRYQRLLILGVILTIGSVISCNRTPSPSDVVRSAYLAANEGRYSVYESLLTEEARAFFRTPEAATVGGLKGALDQMTQNGTIVRVEILSEDIRGEGATVRIHLYFKDGSKAEGDESLVLQQGMWRLTAK